MMVQRSNLSDETERERKRPGFETACIQFIFQFQETTRLRYKTSRIDVIDIDGCIAKCKLGEMVEHARQKRRTSAGECCLRTEKGDRFD